MRLARRRFSGLTGSSFISPLQLHDVVYLVEEEEVYAGEVGDAVVVHAQPHELRDGENTVVRAVLDVVEQPLYGHMRNLGR